MEVTLPVQKVKISNGKKIVESREQSFELDMTLAAQMRYEAKFPELAKKESLYDYTKRILTYDVSREQALSLLKTLYCWFATDMSFIDFVKMFDFTDKKYINNLFKRMYEIFEIIFDGSSEKN